MAVSVASVASVAAASAWALWPERACVSTATNEGRTRHPSLTIVFDEHLPDSRAFALRARAFRARIVPLSSETKRDIGALWFETLLPEAVSADSAIAGLTRHADAFVLTRFALAAGMRLTQRTIEGRAEPDALTAWRLDAPAAHSRRVTHAQPD
jgi:hypothetical protein